MCVCILRDTVKFPSTDVVPFCSPLSNLGLFSQGFAIRMCYQIFHRASSSPSMRGKKWYLSVILISISFTSEIKHLFTCLIGMCIFFSVNYLFNASPPNPLEL